MRTICRLLRFLRPFRREVSLSILAGIATICTGIGMLGTSAYLIASAALHPSIADLQVAIVGVRFFGIARSGFRYLERLVSHSVNLKVLAGIRVWFYKQIEELAPAKLQDYHSGDLLNRVMADLETLENFFVRVVSPVFAALVITAGMSLFLGGYGYQIGVILLIGMAINGVILPGVFILATKKTGERTLVTRSDLSSLMVETFQGLEDLQAFGAQQRWLDKIEKKGTFFVSLQQRNGLLTGVNDALVLIVTNLTLLAVITAAIPLVGKGTISGISLAVVTLLTMASFEATSPLPLAAQNLMASLAAGKRLFEVASSAEMEPISVPQAEIGKDIQMVETRQIRFRYPGSRQPVLEDINIQLVRGKKVALVGPSGAGKTSLVNLLLGFLEPDSGQILVDGQNYRFFQNAAIQRIFSVISQSTYLFADSLRNNLLLAKPDAVDAELLSALQKVELREWFSGLPQGLDTWLGERGLLMSGGERQRLALARVLLQNTPFVLLDEPTSNLDPETERKVMTMMLSSLSDRGILLITHEMSNLPQMDEINFLQEGHFSEVGSEQALIDKRGDLWRFFHLREQFIRD